MNKSFQLKLIFQQLHNILLLPLVNFFFFFVISSILSYMIFYFNDFIHIMLSQFIH